jgi:hypothetical protein
LIPWISDENAQTDMFFSCFYSNVFTSWLLPFSEKHQAAFSMFCCFYQVMIFGVTFFSFHHRLESKSQHQKML